MGKCKPRSQRPKFQRVCAGCGRIDMVNKDRLIRMCLPCGASAGSVGRSRLAAEERGKKEIRCMNCDKTFYRPASNVGARVFCDLACWRAYYRTERQCKQCGIPFTIPRSRTIGPNGARAGLFCSRTCFTSWRHGEAPRRHRNLGSHKLEVTPDQKRARHRTRELGKSP